MVAVLMASTSSIAYAQTTVAPPVAEGPSVVLEADQVTSDDKAGQIVAEGHVEARYEGRTLRAEKLIYDTNKRTVHAVGRVEILDEDGAVQFADELEVDDALNAGVATGFSSRIPGGGTIVAASVVRRPDKVNELNRVVYTACPVCADGRPPSWSLRARKAMQNTNNDTISYRDVVLQVHGVPVLWLPYFQHPDTSSDRASGLLPPDIGQKRRLGVFYEQPYYWAISPFSELTIAPRFMANVNPLLSFKYKKRFWSGEVEAQGSITDEQDFDNNGNRFGDKTVRSHLFANGNFAIDDYWKWGFGVARTSDDLYLKRYDISEAKGQTGLFLNDLSRLYSHLDLTGQDAHSYTNVSFISPQGLRAGDGQANLPLILPVGEYQRLWRDPVFDGQLKLIASTADLIRSNPGVDSARVSGGLQWNVERVFGPGVMVSPFAEARSDLYRVMNYTSSGEQYISRNVGLAGAAVRWPFMRPGDHVNWLVEPIAMAALGSYGGNDSRIPNEDSQSLEIDDSNVFRPAGVGNYDLWEGGPRASIGVRATAMTDKGAATATIGHRWQENADPTFSPITNLGSTSSDWVASMAADLGPQFGGAVRLRLDDQTLSVNRFDASLHGKIDRVSGVVRYFKVDPSLTTTGTPTQEVAGTIGLKLTDTWDVSYGVRRDLASDINLSQNAHLTYRDNCMFLEFVYTRTETQDRSLGPSEGFQIRVGLSTLGVFGGS